MDFLKKLNKIELFFKTKSDEEIKEMVKKNEVVCEQLELFEILELNIKSKGGY